MEPYIVAVIVAASVIFVLATVLIPSGVAYKMTFYSDRKKKRDPYRAIESAAFDSVREKCRKNIDELYALPSEEISVKSHDGLVLRAHFYKGRDGEPFHLMFHGYKSSAFLDFSGGAIECIERGGNVILIDQRAHGDSEGKTISFGVRESLDVHTWIKYTEERFGSDITVFLWGISMGAATVISSLEFPVSGSVAGVIADCPFSSPLGIITRGAGTMGLPRAIGPFLMRPAALIWGGFRLGHREAKRAIRNARVPVLLIHGDGDTFVPRYMSDEIYKEAMDAGVGIEYHVFPGAEHAMSYLEDKERYTALTDAFLKNCIEKKQKTEI